MKKARQWHLLLVLMGFNFYVQSQIPRAPLYHDPITKGDGDPTIIKDPKSGDWLMFYTQHRSNVKGLGDIECYYGTKIGMARSVDKGKIWKYAGTAQGLEFESGLNTFWAPEVIWNETDQQFHMFVTYVKGVHNGWNNPKDIYHYTGLDLVHWVQQGKVFLPSKGAIDACVFKMPSGQWRLFYKNEDDHGGHTWAADSKDLKSWKSVGPVITDRTHEGPYVFRFKGFYWMIVDVWAGQGVYRSADAEKWERQPDQILNKDGARHLDQGRVAHAMVVTNKDKHAYLIYFCPPFKDRRTVVQVTELKVSMDKWLTGNRDSIFKLHLP